MACKNFHFMTTATLATDTLVLTPSDTNTIVNEQNYCFRICAIIPTGTTDTTPVQIVVNGANVPLLNKYGNQVYATSLRRRINYRGYFGNVTSAHIITKSLPATNNCNCNL